VSTRTIKQRFPGFVFASALLLGLVACQTSPPPAESAYPSGPGVFSIPPGSTEYRVNGQESVLQILVYRGGPMAKLGHNHVIASHHLEGAVYAMEDPLRTRFDVSFPVAELTVDEPAMRDQAGPDFANLVPQSARDGTRNNLLSAALLDGAIYPTIRLRALEVLVAGEGYEVGVEIMIKDQVHVVRVPVTLRRDDNALVASGEFPLKQSALGLKPFTAAMGALAVVDEMRVRFEVVCFQALTSQALRATTENGGQGPPSVKM
jgi:polyisoprenoid-binding protein YceI